MRSDDFERLYEEHAAALLKFLELRVGNGAALVGASPVRARRTTRYLGLVSLLVGMGGEERCEIGDRPDQAAL